MTFIVSDISVAEAATIINAIITFIQHTLFLSLVILLIFFMPKANSALTWSSITRSLHSCLWPTILRTDSSSSEATMSTVSTLSYLATISTILIPIAGVTLPLGLQAGPLLPSSYQYMDARYLPDTSAIARATSPNRHEFQHGRVCGDFLLVPCPGNSENSDSPAYAPSIVEVFNSTPHNPFSLQFRRFYNGGRRQNVSNGLLGTSQSFILRDDAFAIEGLIVDMSLEKPGVGFWNHSVPNLPNGGTWSQDILWLEPVTECVHTNLTVDYVLRDGPDLGVRTFNITDRGGFFSLTQDPPSTDRDGQRIDLRQHAHKGAVYSNLYAMIYLNATRESSFDGKPYPFNGTFSVSSFVLNVNKITSLPLSYLNASAADLVEIACKGFGGADIANLTNVYVACAGFLGPPLRTDGGDRRIFEGNSSWSQGIHVCASATRASIQRVTFSANDTSRLQNIQVSRRTVNSTVLWAVEKADMRIADVELMWGRVDDRFEDDPSLWTVRSDRLYLPAGGSAISPSLVSGEPLAAHSAAWDQVYNVRDLGIVADYTGSSDYAMKTKFQSMIEENPTTGPAQIRNAIWTDIMANNVVGTQSTSTLWVAPNQKSLEYDFRFAIPGFILLAMWIPAFVIAIVLLCSRRLTFSYMRKVLNHTSIGRVVIGDSGLRVPGQMVEGQDVVGPEPSLNASVDPVGLDEVSASGVVQEDRPGGKNWTFTPGASTLVVLDLSREDRFSIHDVESVSSS